MKTLMDCMAPSISKNLLGLSTSKLHEIYAKTAVVEHDETECWIWMGSRVPEGYGMVTIMSISKVPQRAHRIAYQLAVGPIPEGYHLHHLVHENKCLGEACINPDHLEPLTPYEHIVNRSPGNFAYRESRQTHCLRGHEFTDANTYIRWDGRKQCRLCSNEQRRQEYVPHPKEQKTHCSKGHPLDGDNLVIYTTSRGALGRGCKACRHAASNRSRDANRAKINQRRRELKAEKRKLDV